VKYRFIIAALVAAGTLALAILDVLSQLGAAQQVISYTYPYPFELVLEGVYLYPGDALAPHLYKWRFDGVDDYLYLTGSAFNFNLYSEFTILVLANRTANYGAVAGYQPSGCVICRSPSMYYWPNVSCFHFGFGDGSRWISTMTCNVLELNKWFLLGIRWSYLSGRLEGIVNADVVGYVSTGSSRPYPNTVYHIGYIDSRFEGYIALVLIYSRALSNEEINAVYTNNVINASGLQLFLDPTFFNESHYLDISGKNNHAVPNGGVYRVPDDNRWLYLIMSLYNDEYIHLLYFPAGTIVRFIDESGIVVQEVFVSSNHEIVQLPPGKYTVVATYRGPIVTVTSTVTATVTTTETPTATLTKTVTTTKYVINTVVQTVTQTFTSPVTVTQTLTDTQTVTQTVIQTQTITNTVTTAATATVTQTVTQTVTTVQTTTLTETRTATATETQTLIQTLTQTTTATVTTTEHTTAYTARTETSTQFVTVPVSVLVTTTVTYVTKALGFAVTPEAMILIAIVFLAAAAIVILLLLRR